MTHSGDDIKLSIDVVQEKSICGNKNYNEEHVLDMVFVGSYITASQHGEA